MICPQCRSRNEADASFCTRCGTRLERRCPECDTPNASDARFCKRCGQAFGPPPPAPLEPAARPSSPLGYTPKHLAEKTLTSRSALEGERTYRPGYAHPFGERTYHNRIALTTLSTADSVQMVQAMPATDSLPEDLETLIAMKAEGNPFFVEEVVKSLEEIGAIRRARDHYVLARRLDEIVIPDTIQKSLFPELAYMFKHALTHDVAYNSLLGQRRSHLRLCDEARAGQILVSARVAAAGEPLIEAGEVGSLALKGLARPVPTWSVHGLRAPATDVDRRDGSNRHET